MKRINFTKTILATSLVALAINHCAFASSHFSASTNNVYVGESFTVTISLSDIAAWNVHINASGPVNGCSTAQADASIDAKNTNKVFTVSCTATDTGTIQISLSGDTTAENGNNETLAGDISVLVTEEKTSPNPTPDPTPNQESPCPSSNSDSYQPTKDQPPQPSNSTPVTKEEPQKSSNKDISIFASEYILSEERGVYKTTVPYNVSEITIKATPKDGKTTITGDGTISLKAGKNNRTIIATSEDGTTKAYHLEITREESPDNNAAPTKQENHNTALFIIALTILLALALGTIVALMLIVKKQKKPAKNGKDDSSPIDTMPPNTTNPYNPISQ